MKICVVQPDLSRIGGSISTIMSFADCFKEIGHDVKIISSYGERFSVKLIPNKNDVLRYYNCKYLDDDDIVWNYDRKKEVNMKADLYFTRGFEITRVGHVPSIIWTVIKNELSYNRNIFNFWTNSNSTYNKFGPFKNKTKVIVPPHDYSVFRENHNIEKEYDIVSILRGNDFKLKGIGTYKKVVDYYKNKKSLLITTYTNNRDLKRIKDLNIPFVTNISREDVAKILGKSKVFFFPSIYESCPLVIYEALNAGCTIVSRNVGAVKEQLDGHGYIFDNNGQILKKLNKAFTNPLDYDKIIDRGIKFDRINQISKIEKELKIVEGRLKNAK